MPSQPAAMRNDDATAELRRQVRRFFGLLARRDREALSTYLHEQVIFVPRIVDGKRFDGREEVLTVFYDDVFTWPIYEPQARRIEVLSGTFAVVRGRVRYMKHRGGLADVPVVWLLGMEDGHLTHLYGAVDASRGALTPWWGRAELKTAHFTIGGIHPGTRPDALTARRHGQALYRSL